MSQIQIETATVIVATTIGTSGNASVIITSAYMTGSPKTFSVAVVSGDDASAVGLKIRNVLVYDAAVSTEFVVSGATDKVILTAHVAKANDTTLNIATDNSTCTGLTAAPNSANTQTGSGITNGYCTLAEYKAYQRITTTDTGDDTFIESAIESASRYIDSQCRQYFYSSTETRYFDTPANARGTILFDAPLVSVTTVTNGDTSVVASTNYFLLPTNDLPKYGIGLNDTSTVGWTLSTTNNHQSAISVLGAWGFSAVPKDLFLATLEMTKAFYSRRFGENMTMKTIITAGGVVQIPDGVPDWVADVICTHTRTGFA